MEDRIRSLANCFFAWFQSDSRDLLPEITVVRRRHRVDIAFKRFPRTLRGCVHHDMISVAAMRGKVCWDFVYDADVSPQRKSAGWVCTQCPEPQIFRSREDLYRDHLFQPFRDWVFGLLATRHCVEFVSLGAGATMAKLRSEAEVPPRIVQAHRRHSLRRDELERSGASRDELHICDRRAAAEIDQLWREHAV